MSAATFTDIRSLHGSGPIRIVNDKNGTHPNQFLTCGIDGTIYIWDEKTFTAKKSNADVKNVGEQTYAVADWIGNDVYFGYLQLDLISGVEKKRVGLAAFDNLEEVTPLMTFNLEPTTIDISEEFLAVGTSEFTIKLMKLKTKTDLATIEVSGEVLCVKIDPNQQYLGAAITDGTVLVFNLKDGTSEEVPEVAKISSVFSSINTISPEFSSEQMAWSQNGDFLYVPHVGSIKVIPRNSWIPLDDGFRAPGRELDSFSICTVSPNGKFLVACTVNRHICVWTTADSNFITQYEYKRNCPGKTFITGINFAPFDERSIIITDSNEGMCLLKNAISSVSSSLKDENITKVVDVKKNKRIMESDDEEDQDDEPKRPVDIFLDDAADEDTNLSADIGAIKKKFGFTNQPTIDDFFTNEGEREPTDFRNLDPVNTGPVIQKVTQVVEYVPPTIPNHFTSGASPRNLSSRFLKWNAFGIIRGIREDDVNNIEIEYHDKNIHSEIVFENTANYSMGDLTDEAIALANIVEGEEEQSELWVYHVTAWDGSNRKWTTNLPFKENAIDVLVSQKLIAVLTNQRNLRLFTLQGTQRHVIAHPGPSLTSCCFGTTFAIISIAGSEYYENNAKSTAQHNYVATIYDLDPISWFRAESNVTTMNIAVKPGETVTWAGYTNTGKLCVVDSSYSVRLLVRGGFWLPIFEGDTITKSRSDALWPVAVVDGSMKQFRYLYCRGSKHPMMALKQVPTIVPWSLPLCQAEADKTKYEQEIFLNELDQNEAIFTGADVNRLIAQHLQSVVHLFALACKMGRDTRAWELSHFVSTAKGIQGLVNFANKTGRSILGEKVAVYGREHMISNDDLPSRRSTHQKQEDFLAPKRVLARRTSMDTSIILDSQQDIFVDSERDFTSQPSHSQDTSLLDISLNMSTTRNTPKNPFKRTAESNQNGTSQSLFDKLDKSFENSTKEDTLIKPTSRKQAKLDFGSGNDKKNSYQEWLEDNEESLKTAFSGDLTDFSKFCIGQFKIFSNSQKRKTKAN